MREGLGREGRKGELSIPAPLKSMVLANMKEKLLELVSREDWTRSLCYGVHRSGVYTCTRRVASNKINLARAIYLYERVGCLGTLDMQRGKWEELREVSSCFVVVRVQGSSRVAKTPRQKLEEMSPHQSSVFVHPTVQSHAHVFPFPNRGASLTASK